MTNKGITGALPKNAVKFQLFSFFVLLLKSRTYA